MTTMGKVTGRVSMPRPRDPFALRLEFRGDSGNLLLSKQLSPGGPYGVSMWQPQIDGLPQGSLVAVSGWMAADRIVFEPFIFGVVSGGFRQLQPALPMLTHADAVCLYGAIGDRPLILTTIEAGPGKCVICWPKQYELVRYHFDGTQFRERWRFTSARTFEDADHAMKHYGVPCTLDLLSAATDHLVKQGPPQ